MGVAVLVLFAAGLAAGPESAAVSQPVAGAWTHQQPDAHPAGRNQAAMATHDPTGQVVLFGGRVERGGIVEAADDTWTWDGAGWTRHDLDRRPSARHAAVMASHAPSGKVVLFGGIDRSNSNDGLDDTWTWDGAGWTKETPTVRPPAPDFEGTGAAHAMAPDPARGTVVLVTGETDPSGAEGQTWTWDGTDWTRQHPTTSPPGVSGRAMAYHAPSQQVVLFGGDDRTDDATWTWDGADWTRHQPPASPPPRVAPAMAQDPAGDGVVLFGGAAAGLEAQDDTWTWDGQSWTPRTPATSPAARYDAAMALHGPSQNAVLFGGNELSLSNTLVCCGLLGEADRRLGDTWTWDGGASPASAAASVQLTLQPPSIPADPARGNDEVEVTVTISAEGQGIPGQQMELSATDDKVAFSEVTDHGDGTYTATAQLTTATTPGQARVTADTALGRDSAELILEGPATRVDVDVAPDTLPADGASQAELTATVTDADHHFVTHEDVTVATDGTAAVSAVTDHRDGTYTATVTASETPGEETLTATATKAGVAGQARLTLEPPAGHVTLRLDPDTLPADGASTAEAIVTVTGADGQPAAGEDVEVATDGNAGVSEVTNHDDGIYTATITAPETVGEETVTATAAKAGVADTAVLTLAAPVGWHRTGSMGYWRMDHEAVQLTGEHCGENCDKVLVVGGVRAGGVGRLGPAELYDPDTGEWRETGDQLFAGVTRLVQLPDTACGSNCGKALLLGTGGAKLYDPATETWSLTGQRDSDGAGRTATLLGGANCGDNCHKVLVTHSDQDGGVADLYDPATGEFTSTAAFDHVRAGHYTATLLDGAPCADDPPEWCGKVLVAGGETHTAELYDPVTETWEPADAMEFRRSKHVAVGLGDGRVLVTGSFLFWGRFSATAEVYDPATGSWETVGGMDRVRAFHAATLLPNGDALLVGGNTAHRPAGNSQRFDPASNRFVESLDLIDPRRSSNGEGSTLTLLGGSRCDGDEAPQWCGAVLKAGEATGAELYRAPPAGPADSVEVTVDPPTVRADGAQTATVTATVTDAAGAPVTDETVAITANGADAPADADGDVRFAAPWEPPVTNHGDGTYTTTVTASHTPGVEHITASAADAGVTGSATLTETHVFTYDEPTLVPNSTTVTTATKDGQDTKQAVFQVSVTPTSDEAVSVDYATVDDTATAGEHYEHTEGTLTFAPGQQHAWISVDLTGEVLAVPGAEEPNRSFTVELSEPVNAALATDEVTGTIVAPAGPDREPPGTGGVYVTGRDPDYHCTGPPHEPSGSDTELDGRERVLHTAVDYVTYDHPQPELLYIRDGNRSSECYAGSRPFDRRGGRRPRAGYQRVDLATGDQVRTVDFEDYDAVVVASTSNLTLDELDALNDRRQDIADYVAGGGGLVAFEEIGHEGWNVERFGFVACLEAERSYPHSSDKIAFHSHETDEFGYTVTPVGAALGLPAVNGIPTHQHFPATGQCGWDVVDRNPQGEALSIATRQGDLTGGLVIDDVEVAEPAAGDTTPAVLTVSLAQPSDEPVTVDYATADDTATAGDHYEAAEGTVEFEPGQVAAQVPVTVVGDDQPEADRAFQVRLADPQGAVVDRGVGTVTITDDDEAGLGVDDVTVAPDDEPVPAVFTVSLEPASHKAVTVDYATEDGSAQAGRDYEAASGTLRFAAGETERTVKVTVEGEAPPRTRQFAVVLSDPVGAGLARPRGTGRILAAGEEPGDEEPADEGEAAGGGEADADPAPAGQQPVPAGQEPAPAGEQPPGEESPVPGEPAVQAPPSGAAAPPSGPPPEPVPPVHVAQPQPGAQPSVQAQPGAQSQPGAQAQPGAQSQPSVQAQPGTQPSVQAQPGSQPGVQLQPGVQPQPGGQAQSQSQGQTQTQGQGQGQGNAQPGAAAQRQRQARPEVARLGPEDAPGSAQHSATGLAGSPMAGAAVTLGGSLLGLVFALAWADRGDTAGVARARATRATTRPGTPPGQRRPARQPLRQPTRRPPPRGGV